MSREQIRNEIEDLFAYKEKLDKEYWEEVDKYQDKYDELMKKLLDQD